MADEEAPPEETPSEAPAEDAPPAAAAAEGDALAEKQNGEGGTGEEKSAELGPDVGGSEGESEGVSADKLQQDEREAYQQADGKSEPAFVPEKETVCAEETEDLTPREGKYDVLNRQALGSVIDIRKGSVPGDISDRKTARYMNTYKLESDNPFNHEKVDKILVNVMTEAIEGLKYDADKCSKQARWASSAIRAKVKELEFDRCEILNKYKG
ncbi:unnamed protein product [Acanthoscelides obtectus]|uniref:Uncharacterized protein n=1 Tax=Acanthoscelides obtectus TaxID=200917 RepID=A0A9P0P5P6_ACAOB|nr:unnamed protein product [Acanthoscelides obtectus]CAK1622859.1 hypothetical protein AOBTE_LOCUS1700 [Acanthoscelides obtectus]